jgi:hypothetical protein
MYLPQTNGIELQPSLKPINIPHNTPMHFTTKYPSTKLTTTWPHFFAISQAISQEFNLSPPKSLVPHHSLLLLGLLPLHKQNQMKVFKTFSIYMCIVFLFFFITTSFTKCDGFSWIDFMEHDECKNFVNKNEALQHDNI